MPTEVIHTIGSGRDFPTLSAWAAAVPKDLAVADEIAAAECYNDALLTDNVVLTGWTTDAEHYIKIYVPTSERHNGVKDTGFTITPATPTNTIDIRQRHVRISGIAFKAHSDSEFMKCIYIPSQTYCDIRISHCLFYGEPVSDPTDNKGIHIFYSEGIKIWNNFFFSIGTGVDSEGSDNIDVENNTLCDCRVCFRTASNSFNPAYRNNIAFSYIGQSFYQRIWFVKDTDYNLDNASNTDYQSPGEHSLHDKAPTANLVDVTRGAANLHIRSDAPDVINKGTDGTHICFTDDIDGHPRPQGMGWNIGADELETEEFSATGVGSLYSGKEYRDEIPNLEGAVNESYNALGGTIDKDDYIEPNHVGNIHHALCKMQNVLGPNPQGNRPNIHRRIWRSIGPTGDVNRIRNVELNETDIRDGRILAFKEDLWELRYEDKTLGADVVSLQGATGDVDVKEGPGIETIYKSGGDGVHIRAEVTQTFFNAHDAEPDAHHNESHTIESHDTNATGAELNTLTNGPTSNADSLHTHPSLGSNLFSFQVTIPGQVPNGRQVAQKIIIPFDCVAIGTEALRFWCSTPGNVNTDITAYKYRPMDDPSSGGTSIATFELTNDVYTDTGDCSEIFEAGDGVVFDINTVGSYPHDLTITLTVSIDQ